LWHGSHNGLFVERQRISTRNSGKPDWKRTVCRELAFLDDEHGDVFPDLATTRSIDSSETLIAQVQAKVLLEIGEAHGWWLDGINARRSELLWQKSPQYAQELWPILLDSLLPRLYSSRSIFLATYLAYYLRNSRLSGSGDLVFGVEDFHSVWEAMLRDTLAGVERGWNEKLPRARYKRGETRSVVPLDRDRSMRTDIVLRDDRGYTIVDAKYYDGTSEGSVPGWPDIAKQMFYEMALRSVVGREAKIRNVFVFPGEASNPKGFDRVVMVPFNGGDRIESFPIVHCHYLPVTQVISQYLTRTANIRV
jgi:hypothetical protein